MLREQGFKIEPDHRAETLAAALAEIGRLRAGIESAVDHALVSDKVLAGLLSAVLDGEREAANAA